MVLFFISWFYDNIFIQAMCNGRHPYQISPIRGEMPNWLSYFGGQRSSPVFYSLPSWMSYSGEGCSLYFHIPPVFQGLVVGFVPYTPHYPLETRIIIIIRNKSNGIQLFEDKWTAETLTPRSAGWIRYISRSEMAMEDYCADDELELYISSCDRRKVRFIWRVISGKRYNDTFTTAISSVSSSSLWFNYSVYT